MAETNIRKPRLRKTAPTVRQKAEQARIEAEKPPKTSRPKRVIGTAARPLKKVKLPRNKLTKPLFKIFSLIGRGLRKIVPKYFIYSWAELKLVTWPGRRETWRLTGAVFGFAIVFGTLIAIVDKILSIIFRNIILK